MQRSARSTVTQPVSALALCLLALLSATLVSSCGSSSATLTDGTNQTSDSTNTPDGGDSTSDSLTPTPDSVDSTSGTDLATTADQSPATPLYKGPHPRVLLTPARLDALRTKLAGPTSAASRFKTMVDQQLAGADHYAFEGTFAALMFQLSGESKYCDYAISFVASKVDGEWDRVSNGLRPEISGDSYLYVGPWAREVLLTYDWCYAALSQEQRSSWIALIAQAVWNVWNHEKATWGGNTFPWSGWSVDNPANNYYYSFLTATMLFGLVTYGEHPEAETWLSEFRAKRLGSQLFPLFDSDLTGGGSREGTGYGVSMRVLFQLYDWWEASTNERLADFTTHTKASLAHMIHSVVPTRDRLAPVGDHARESTAALFDYHRAYVLTLASLYPDDALGKVGQQWLSQISVDQMSQKFMYFDELLYARDTAASLPLSTLYPTYYGSGTGTIAMRSSWDTEASWAHLIVGPYTESHAHQDQGSFLIYHREWLAYDQNIGSHSGIEQFTTMHNLVRLSNGQTVIPQVEGHSGTLSTLKDTARYTAVACDTTATYTQAGITAVRRQFVYIKPDIFVVYDRLETTDSISKMWQLNSPLAPQLNGAAATLAGTLSTLTVRAVLPANASFTSYDWSTSPIAMPRGGWQLQLTQSGATATYLMVLDLNGAVSKVEPLSDAQRDGVKITRSNGGSATLYFLRSGPGGAITLSEGNSIVVDDTISAGIQQLPLLAP